MKFIGLVTAWGCDRWISKAIEQALNICDEVIVSVGPHSNVMKQFEDNTLNICESYGDKIKMVPVVFKSFHGDTKAATMNRMLEYSSLFDIGNWIWLLDADEFYFPEDVKIIKETAKTEKYNFIYTNELFFYVNMKRYLKSMRGRVWRIENKNERFYPTNNWTGKRDKKIVVGKKGMFHYSLLFNPYAKIKFWETEYNKRQDKKVRWMKEIYMNYDFSNEDFWVSKNVDIVGEKTPLLGGDIKPDENGRCYIYKGKHPPLIEQSDFVKNKRF